MLDEKALDQLAYLCKIECSPEEKARLQSNLNRILKYIEKLQEIDTEGVDPCYLVSEGASSPLREDIPLNSLSREEFLQGALHTGGLVRVPPVIHFANP